MASGIRLNPDLLPSLLASIQRSQQNQTNATEQLASGQRVNALSDDAAASAAVVGNHDRAGQDDQYLTNISSLQSLFQVGDSTLSNVVTVLTRAISLGTEGATGTLNDSDRADVAGEVQGLLQQLTSLANTTYKGTYVFSGTAVTTKPFTFDPTTNTVTYNGNTQANQVQISDGTFIGNNVPGSQLFQNAGGDAFGALQNLVSSLQSNTNIGAAVTQLQDALGAVSTQRVFYGNALNQINLSQSFLNQDKVNLSTQENALIGVDPAKAASDLVQAQTANQAVLSAAGRTLSLPTLLDFLK